MMQWVRFANERGWNFEGRSRRSEYWYNALFYGLISFGVSIVSSVIAGILSAWVSETLGMIISGLLTLACSVFVFIKVYPIAIRRLHDTGKPGWIYWLCMAGSVVCGIGSIVLLVFTVLDSTPGMNQYGPNPKGIDDDMGGGFGGPGGYQQNPYGQPGGYQQPGGFQQNPYGGQPGGYQQPGGFQQNPYGQPQPGGYQQQGSYQQNPYGQSDNFQ